MLAGMILKQGKKAEFVAIKVSWRQHSLKCEFVFVFPREEEQRPCDVTYSICSSACMSAGVIGRHRHTRTQTILDDTKNILTFKTADLIKSSER